MSSNESSNESSKVSNDSHNNGGKITEAKPAPVKIKLKPQGPPNVVVRTYAEEIVNKKDTDND